MKTNIIGGGPAGLYFAILMKKADPAHDITIHERNGPDDTFGWGVVFSGKTLANLKEADEDSFHRITDSFQTWDNVDVVHRDQKITIRGNHFSGVARLELLRILHQRCRELNVQLHFRADVSDNQIEELRRSADLLIGADGVNSTVRQKYADTFQPILAVRTNRYIWYGTRRLFHGLTLTFRENDAGVFAAHSYKFNQTTSTFIVECDEPTWIGAGFAGMTHEDTRRYLETVFQADLDKHPLLSNNSKWINFLLVKNARWHYENVVLLGDALHTAHFSIGSGTKLAFEDAIALEKCFTKSGNVRSALEEFEKTRKPVIEEYQAAAYDSMVWFENARDYMHLDPIELAYVLMTRSGRVDLESLRRRDPAFVAAYEAIDRSKCFRKDAKIKTELGWKDIESICQGESVWTHRGRWRRVIGVQSRPHVGRMIGLRVQSSEIMVWCTPEQRFLIVSPSPQAERGTGGEVEARPTPNPSPLAGRGEIQRRLGGVNPALLTFARKLQSEGTSAEEILWAHLRRRNLRGIKFRRQHPLGANYIVDFYAPEVPLAIELDGSVHDSAKSQWADGIRHRQIQVAGVRVLRFRNERILNDLEGVLEEIGEHISPLRETESGETGSLWCEAQYLHPGDNLITCESGDATVLESVEFCFTDETVFDLTIEEDHSFVTEAGVAHNSRTD